MRNLSDQPVVYPLFSVPVYYIPDTKFRADKQTIDTLLDIERFPNWNQECGLSADMFILEHTEFSDIRRVCEFHLQKYIKEVCGFDNEFYITNSWISRNAPGIDHRSHAHPNSIFSGCLYLKSSPRSILTISSENHFNKKWNFTYNIKNPNIYNSTNWPVSVDTGALVIWPSDIRHESNQNPLNETRLVMCFNTFIRGDIGKDWYGTDLILK